MIGFGFWDGSNNGFAGVNDDVLNFLDFPMESLEGDGLGEDLDAKFQRLGPIPWEALQRLSSTPTLNIQNGCSDMQSNSSIPSKQTCQLNQQPEFVEETSSINNPHNSSIVKDPPAPLEPPHSPISALSSSGSSCSGEKTTPVFLNSPKNKSTPRKSRRKKKKLSKPFTMRVGSKKCAHCESIRTPQWRDGPMGPKTLCNACGVRYRTGRLLPEYRPAGSPTFVSSVHSNLHKKVIEMRNRVESNKCTHCESTKTPQWRDGPMGPKTLCNACGVRYQTGRLLPEYRPVGSPTFVPSMHSNLHKKVLEMRNGTKEASTVESECAISPKPEKI